MEFEGAFYNTVDFNLTNKKLGEGGFGRVYVIQSVKDNRNYAVKIINTDQGFDGTQQMQLMRESMILHQLHHPCIVRFYGINFQSLITPGKLEPSIITEYLPNGSLKSLLDKEKNSLADDNWTPTKRYISLIGIASAMRYLHANNIIHRDLKPQNILIDSDYYPRVCDFGLSRCLPDSLTKSTEVSMTKEVGTPLYMAPELLQGDSHYDPSVDVYAFAILAYEIVTGKNPYHELGKVTPFKLANKVMRGYRPKFDNNITKKMKNLLSRCWNENISERPSFDEIYKLLTTDFSFFEEDVDEDEINQYIEDIEDEIKRSNNKPNKVEQNDQNHAHPYEILDYYLYTSLNNLLGHEKNQNFQRAAYILRLASDEGNSLASFILGLLHESGKGVTKNPDIAKNYYKQAAAQGNTYGYLYLGHFFYDGYECKEDYAKAFKYYQKAANFGNKAALISVGFCYYVGKGVAEDEKKAVKLYEKALEQGDYFAYSHLGCCYKGGYGVEKNYSKALEYFQKGAEKGDSYSIRSIGDLYKEGLGVKKNFSKAFEYFKKAADQGLPIAYSDLGDCYEDGIGVRVDHSKAIECYQKAGDLGLPESYIKLYNMYFYGTNVEKDVRKCFEYAKKAADLKSMDAYVKLGFHYHYGIGVDKNYAKAVEYYQKGIENDNYIGYQFLGHCYLEGLGVPQSYSKAFELYQKGADGGDNECYLHLGLLYQKGNGVAKNNVKAFECMKKAADSGYESAAYNIGVFYEQGIGTSVNKSKAYEYYKKSADLGCDDAKKKLKEFKY